MQTSPEAEQLYNLAVRQLAGNRRQTWAKAAAQLAYFLRALSHNMRRRLAPAFCARMVAVAQELIDLIERQDEGDDSNRHFETMRLCFNAGYSCMQTATEIIKAALSQELVYGRGFQPARGLFPKLESVPKLAPPLVPVPVPVHGLVPVPVRGHAEKLEDLFLYQQFITAFTKRNEILAKNWQKLLRVSEVLHNAPFSTLPSAIVSIICGLAEGMPFCPEHLTICLLREFSGTMKVECSERVLLENVKRCINTQRIFAMCRNSTRPDGVVVEQLIANAIFDAFHKTAWSCIHDSVKKFCAGRIIDAVARSKQNQSCANAGPCVEAIKFAAVPPSFRALTEMPAMASFPVDVIEPPFRLGHFAEGILKNRRDLKRYTPCSRNRDDVPSALVALPSAPVALPSALVALPSAPLALPRVQFLVATTSEEIDLAMALASSEEPDRKRQFRQQASDTDSSIAPQVKPALPSPFDMKSLF